ncbi:integrase [Pseudomonas azotoformans]
MHAVTCRLPVRRIHVVKGKVWVGYYYRDSTGKEIPLGGDLSKARLKWAELESKEKPADLTMMKGIFDRYVRDVIPKKGERTQKDNLAELKQLRPMFDGAPIDSITPASIAGYRDARTAKVRANREIALLSHVFNMAREWGLTERKNPCQGIRKNKETPRDYYANAAVWDAVYGMAEPELKEAMDLGYLTGQRPADVIVMRRDKAREKACAKAIEEGDPLLAAKIGGFQFRDIRPKAASEIIDIGDASLLLGHSKQEITKRVYRRIGATAKPSK